MTRMLFNAEHIKCDDKMLESMLKEYVKIKIGYKRFDYVSYKPFIFGNKDFKHIPRKVTLPLEDNVYVIIDICKSLEAENISYACNVSDNIILAVSCMNLELTQNIIKTAKKNMPAFITLDNQKYVYVFKTATYIKFNSSNDEDDNEDLEF